MRSSKVRWRGGDLLHLGCVCEWKEFAFREGMGLITVIYGDKGLLDRVGSASQLTCGSGTSNSVSSGYIDQGWREDAR